MIPSIYTCSFRSVGLFFFFQVLFMTYSFGQIYGNEWIHPGQSYYKIPVAQTGIYAVSFNQLRASGVGLSPSGNILPEELQLFRRGVEQAVWINNDSLFFYGQRNDGTLDSLLYNPYSKQPHKYYSLYSDTAAYFLTWEKGVNGKRMNNPAVSSSSGPEDYHTDELLQVYTDSYSDGYLYSIETYMSEGDEGEGWFGQNIGNGGTLTYTFNPRNAFTGGPASANMEIMMVGKNGLDFSPIHNPVIILKDGVNPDYTITPPAFAYHEAKKYTTTFPVSYLTSGNLSVSVKNVGTISSIFSVAYIRINYPQTCNMDGAAQKFFNLLPQGSTSVINIQNAPSEVRIFDVTNSDQTEVVPAEWQGGVLTASLGLSPEGHRLLAVAPSAYLSASKIYNVNLSPWTNIAKANFIIVSHFKLMQGARSYAIYRASGQGGKYDTLLAEINNLYDRFTYGETTPLAIKRMMQYLADKGNPQYLFLIGKGLQIDYNRGGGPYRRNPGYYIHDPNPDLRRESLIPTYGKPGSDLLFTTGLKGKPQSVAGIPVGRFSALNNMDVVNYLNKVQEHEALPNALWRKNLLHLSGGHYDYEKDIFRNHMNALKVIAEDTVFGGKVVKTLSKKGSESVDDELIGSVANVINEGVSYMSFFGHSTGNFTDLDIGFVSLDFYGYHNKGKYPLMMLNGCGSAQMYSFYSFSEDWLRTPDRGAIVTLGHTNSGYVNELMDYSSFFYINAFRKRSMAGKSVGEVQLGTIEDYLNSRSYVGAVDVATVQQMVIQGDPSLKIYAPEKPDYETGDAKVSIRSYDNRTVTAVSDSFSIAIAVANLGVDMGDSLNVTITRTVNGKVMTYGPRPYKHIRYSDTIFFKIESPDVSTFGENIFEIMLDPGDSIDEISELNNRAVLRYFMPLSAITALTPGEYSIVSSSPVTLIAQSTNLLLESASYYVEIDTSYLFNSPKRKDTIINGGALIRWPHLSLPVLKDSVVYYWRARYSVIPAGSDTLYGKSSFIYISGSPEGWSQSAFPQFLNDGASQIERNLSQKKWQFSKTETSVSVRTVGTNYVRNPPNIFYPSYRYETSISLFDNSYTYRDYCYPNSILAIAFDRVTARPYTPYPPEKGGKLCGFPGKDIVNAFDRLNDPPATPASFNGAQNQSSLVEFINNVPDGDYILLLSTGEAYFNNWGSGLKNKLKNDLGADSLDLLSNGMSYALLAKKGDPDPLFEVYKPNTASAVLEVSDTLKGINENGFITSTLIGPASSWGTLYHTFRASEYPKTDTDSIMIIGVNMEGLPVDTIAISQKDTLDLNTVPGISNYPYIRLMAEVKDHVNLTPPQLKKWQVIYSGVPEGTMNPGLIGLATYNPVTKTEGDSLKICYAFENISGYDFIDTLQVKLTVTNSSKISSEFVKLRPLKKDSVLRFCYSLSTNGLEGTNKLQAYVNPRLLKEQYYTNNILETSFNVFKDKTHPVLDVVFDGMHIMDGDIVSPSPMIVITLNDENVYQIRNNSDGIELFLLKPGQTVPLKVDPSLYTGKQLGGTSKNSYQIEYNPVNLPDGKYTLIVRAKDVTGNASGIMDYKISFEVINESSITNFYPYPNPFSTSTRFVFTLTGSELPQDFKIQIMTVTGKVVREITMAEIGHIRIGNNKTDYAWDGTDEFGDKLANGIYLYRVVIKNADAFHHRSTAGDKAFKKDFGKLYILR